MTEIYATIIFLFVLFALLGSSVWIGLALMGVAWVAWSFSRRVLRVMR